MQTSAVRAAYHLAGYLVSLLGLNPICLVSGTCSALTSVVLAQGDRTKENAALVCHWVVYFWQARI